MSREKQRGFAFAAAFILVLSLCSCASRSAVNEKQLSVYLTDSARYILLPPDGIEKPMDMAQFISASYGGRDFYFSAWVQADAVGMELTLLNELGAAMGELSYRDGLIHFSSPVFPGSIKPEYIVADFQLCFYDPLMLGAALENCGLALETSETRRRVLKGNNVIIEIEKTDSIITIKNNVRGYTYTLEGEF